jgi:hypothetical protein
MELMNPAWRKSSYSGNGANCVEAGSVPGHVLVRDTRQRERPGLARDLR